MEKCGVKTCKNKARLYGTCGVHKKFAYKHDDQAFLCELKDYSTLVQEFKRLFNELSERGIHPFSIQGQQNNNIIIGVSSDSAMSTNSATVVFSKLRPAIMDMQKRWDAYLVCNATTRLGHERDQGYPECGCTICGLGK